MKLSGRHETDLPYPALLLATAAALPKLFRPVTWFDEVNTIELVTRDSWVVLFSVDAPLWYVGAKLYTLTNLPMVTFRATSLLFFFGTLYFTYKIAKYYTDTRSAHVASVALALNSTVIEPASWLRMYSMLVCLVTLLWWLVLSYQTKPRPKSLVLISLAAVLTHQTGIVAVLLCLGYFVYREKHYLAGLSVVGIAGGVAGVFILPRLLAATFGDFDAVPHLSTPPDLSKLLFTPSHLFGQWQFTAQTYMLGLPFLGLLLFGVSRAKIREGWTAPLFAVLATVVFYTLFSHLVSPIYTLKYFLWLSPLFVVGFVVLAESVDEWLQTWLWASGIVILASGFVY